MDKGFSPLPKGRTLPIDGAVVRTLRIQKGWEITDLAAAAKCSEKTIQNIEARRDKHVYAYMLTQIAQSLDVDWVTLVTSAISEPSAVRSAKQERRISGILIVIPEDFAEFDQTQVVDIIELLLNRIKATSTIDVIAVRPANSVAIKLEMSEEDCLRMVAAFYESRLDDVEVEQIELPPIALRSLLNDKWYVARFIPFPPTIVRLVEAIRAFREREETEFAAKIINLIALHKNSQFSTKINNDSSITIKVDNH